jgi:hypothetical protein
MTVTASFLHAVPHQKIATQIRDRLARCREARIVSGFATPDGVAALRVGPAAKKIARLVLGAGTFKAFEALDNLIATGLPASAARLHLGFSRDTGRPKNPFERLRPMLHSKIYYFEMPDGTAAAFVGSHNLTGFALRGMNGEAAVLLEGATGDPTFTEVRAHIEEAYRTAHPYDTSLKEAYARWYADYLDRLRIETGDMPRTGTGGRTLILMAEATAGTVPAVGEAVYFELDKRIETVNAIDAQVHLYLFPRLPYSPRAGLAELHTAPHAFHARVQAIDSRAGSAEINADWFVDQPPSVLLTSAPRPFRPMLSPGKQQVTVLIEGTLGEAFEYEFEGPERWLPEFGPETLVDEEMDEVWSPVVGLYPDRALPAPARPGSRALMELSPDSGSYILLSRGRTRRNG